MSMAKRGFVSQEIFPGNGHVVDRAKAATSRSSTGGEPPAQQRKPRDKATARL